MVEVATITSAPAPLWDHQEQAVQRIIEQEGTLLGFEMGTGKSRCVVEHNRRRRPRRTLILCPKSVVGVWPHEFHKHAPDHDVFVVPLVKGTGKDKVEQARKAWQTAHDADTPLVLVVNYESARIEPLATALLKPLWDVVVLDESHRVKAPAGKTSRWCARLGKRAVKRVALTGTPMPHSPLDIWAQYRFLDDRIFPSSFHRFKFNYAIMGGFYVNGKPVQVVGWKNQDDLHQKVYSIGMRVTKDEVLDLPPVLHVQRFVELPARRMAEYRCLKRELVIQLEEGTVSAANALVAATRLQQLTSGFAVTDDGGCVRFPSSPKDHALQEILEDVGPSQPVVVFARFRSDLEAAAEVARACGRAVDFLHGDQNDIGNLWEPRYTDRQFAEYVVPHASVACIQIQAGGLGIDLTAASNVVYYSQTYNLGDYEQSLARSHRMGQTQKVTYYHLLAKHTIDTRIVSALERRKRDVSDVLEFVRDLVSDEETNND